MLKIFSSGLSLIALLPSESVAFVTNPLASKPQPCAPTGLFPQSPECQQHQHNGFAAAPLPMMKDSNDQFFFANTIASQGKKKSSQPKSATSASGSSSNVGPLPMMTGNDFSSFQQHSHFFMEEKSPTNGSNTFHSSQKQQHHDQGRQHHNTGQSFFSLFDSRSNIHDMEKEIMASTQTKLDIKRIKNLFIQDDEEDDVIDVKTTSVRAEPTKNVAAPEVMALSVYEEDKTNSVFETVTIQPNPSTWSVAVASGSVLGLLSFLALQLPLLSFTVFLLTTYVASRDPVLDEDLVAGDLTGPVTRTLGRATLDAMESMKPTFRAVMRAILSGDEMKEIRSTNKELVHENDDLKIQIARREAIEDLKKHYTVKSLKEIARRDGLKVSGNKMELMMRLLENDSIPLQSPVKSS